MIQSNASWRTGLSRNVVLWVGLVILMPTFAHAKRTPPPKVEPVVQEGVRYTAPNNDGKRASVRALDAKTDKLLWEVTVFRNTINPALEEDVQWIFIKKLRTADGNLVVIDERNRAYRVDLKTRAVEKLKEVPPEKP
jgi:hypothetical protein